MIKQYLEETEKRLGENHASEAEISLGRAIALISPDSPKELVEAIGRLVKQFYPRRKKKLQEALEKALSREKKKGDDDALQKLKELWTNRFKDLPEQRIFQWTTQHREAVQRTYAEAFEYQGDVVGACAILREIIARYSTPVFRRRFESHISRNQSIRLGAVKTSLSGVQQFAELVTENYTNGIHGVENSHRAQTLRVVSSAILSGVIQGFGVCQFDEEQGWRSLERMPEFWAHYLPYLTSSDLTRLKDNLDAGDLHDSLELAIGRISKTFDSLLQLRSDWVCLPRQAYFDDREITLDFKIGFARTFSDQLIFVRCFMSRAKFRRQEDTQRSVNSGIHIILAPSVHPNYRDSRETLVLEWDTSEMAGAIIRFLEHQFSLHHTDAPIKNNPAKGFPLDHAQVQDYFRVHRASVQDLFGRCNTQTGIRLWCSIRRSGKTTSCFALTQDDSATLVRQTMVRTDAYPNDGIFVNMLFEKLNKKEYIDPKFVELAVKESARDQTQGGKRYVLILDEYDALFDLLAFEARDEEKARRIVDPFLDQLVAFSRNNLVILLGQSPSAHRIRMNRTQLSASLMPDEFPLFEHGSEHLASEFTLLIQKILATPIRFDRSFADAVYGETTGHPYLTVNVLVEFCDWLIDTKRSRKQLAGVGVTADDFAAFSHSRLVREHLLRSHQYGFFRDFISEGIGSEARTQSKWVFGVLTAIREICAESPTRFAIPKRRYFRLMDPILADLGITSETLLEEGVRTNFLRLVGDDVGPAIRIIGRIASVVLPRR